MDNTNPGNRPLGGAPRNGGPQPPQYQRPPQQQWGPGPQPQYQQPQYQQGQYQQPQYPQGQYQQQYQPQWGQQPQYEEKKKSKGSLIAALIAILALLIAAVLAWGYFQGGWFNSNSANGYSSSKMTESPSSGSGDEEDSSSSSSTTSRAEGKDDDESSDSRPEDPQLPSNAVPVNEAARSGKPAGDFNNVYRGSDVTSEPFSLAVRDKFVEQWMDTRDGDATIRVYSTVTGQSYSMDCNDNGKYITCTGGNNAIVYIA